ncbi:unnamed protein product [Oppiella nova]|uniref:Uncharacterized protein n=1 Tax=Oppiella nova TaxID=334625 RepID=A0A7R9MJ22_9ACAR|nr:unnamed protein product [Oppiella nova]CAG2177887.1 unnamed protein product [Oppiella nova]
MDKFRILSDIIVAFPMQSMATYFMISGLLQANGQVGRHSHGTGSTSAVNYLFSIRKIVRRFVRLMPSVGAVIAFTILLEVLGSGPVWHQYININSGTCHHNWWATMLNLKPFDGMRTLLMRISVYYLYVVYWSNMVITSRMATFPNFTFISSTNTPGNGM